MNMHPDSLADSNDAPSRLDADPTWDVVIVYDDARAGRRAMITLDDVVHKLGGQRRLHPQLWRFDLLEDPDWCAAATAEAVQASLLIISASSKGALPKAVQHFIHGWLGQSRGTAAAALAALLGPADDPDALDSTRVHPLRSAAEAAGLSFFAPVPPLERSPESPTQANPAVRASPRILLVEDDPAVCLFSTRALVGAGYQVDAVEGGQPGWEALQARLYDLLITDNRMPGLTGSDLILKVRSARMTLPVILASGGMVARELTQSSAFQPVRVLPKPFTLNQLLETVAGVLHWTVRDLASTRVSIPASGDFYCHWGLNE